MKSQRLFSRSRVMEPLYHGLRPTQDIVFQYVFSSVGCEPGLLGFINAVRGSEGFPLVKAVEVKNPFNIRQSFDDKASILDIRAVDDLNQTYNIEMQTTKEEFFRNRIMYYWSRVYGSQMQSGEGYETLKPAISIILTEFIEFPDLWNLHNVFTMVSRADPRVEFSDQQVIHVLELAKPKMSRLSECTRPLQSWLYFLKNVHTKTEAEMEPFLQDEPGLDVAYHKFREFSQDELLRDLVLRQEMAEHDRVSALRSAEKRGIEKGIAKGIEKGIEKGIAKGIEKGIAKGFEKGIAEERASKVVEFLRRRFPKEFSPEIEFRIRAITDVDLLDTLFWEVVAAEQIQDVTKYL